MSSPLAMSGSAEIDACEFGQEKQPVLRADDCLADPARVVEIAAAHEFRPIGEFYPGTRAAVSEAVAMPLVMPLLGEMERLFALSRPPRFRECYLSLVTQAPGDLAPIQRLPHFDGLERERLAVLLYLDAAERGGTAFYRQRATGFESVDDERFDRYRSELQAGVDKFGMPASGYISGDTELFERVHAEKDTFNSMVVYRSNTLHCAQLDSGFVPDPDPRSGRLTLNLFLD